MNAGSAAKNATTGVLVASSNAISFGAVPVGQSAKDTVSLVNSGSDAVQISQVGVTGQFFAIEKAPDLPVTVASGGSLNLTVQFMPGAAGIATGSLTVASDASNAETATVGLSGSGAAASGTLQSFTCAAASLTGAGGTACTVTLSSAAPAGGASVNLASSSDAVLLPASVTVPAGATTVSVPAAVSPVVSAQTVTLTASAAGIAKSYALQLSPAIPALSLSVTSLNFGDVQVNQPGTLRPVTLTSSGTAPLTVTAATVAGGGFTISGMSFPLTLNPGQTASLSIQFEPGSAGAVTGAVTLFSNASSGSTAVISLSGTGDAAPGALNGLSCRNGSVTGAGTDVCTVSLTAAAAAGGLTIQLSSSSGSVVVPASAAVAAGATSTAFTANIAAVTSAQTVALTARAGNISKTWDLQLQAARAALTLSSTAVAFGNVTVNTPSTQSVKLTSSGTIPLTISAATVAGAGFSLSGLSLPLTLNPGQTASLNFEFDPTSAGGVTGSARLTTNASSGASVIISLNGTGEAVSYQVDLTWNAPTGSSDPVAGYNVYRTFSGTSSWNRLNSLPVSGTAYQDTSVQNGTTYIYMVQSVDGRGAESAPSNIYTVSVP